MTKKLTQMLAIFMAMFLFSCATEDPALDISGGIPEAPVVKGDLFGKALNKIRSGDDTVKTLNNAFWTEAKVGNSSSVKMSDIGNSYLVTKIGDGNATGTEFVVLFIKKSVNGFSDISMGANTDLNVAMKQAESKEDGDYFDPRKLLYDDSKINRRPGLKMAWVGRVGRSPALNEFNTALGQVDTYDTFKSVDFATGKTFSVDNDYTVQNYQHIKYTTGTYAGQSIHSTGLMKMGPGLSDIALIVIHDGRKSWGWSLKSDSLNNGANIWVSKSSRTSYGNATKGDKNDFLYGSYVAGEGSYKSELSTIESLQENNNGAIDSNPNNYNPKGKIVMGRNNGGRTGIFLIPVVGYNIRIKDDAKAEHSITSSLGELAGVKKVQQFYMEFDATSHADAAKDGYTSARDFPHWNAINDEGDGASIDSTGKKVQKFTGILLKM